MKSILTQYRAQQKRARMRRFIARFGILVIVGGGSILFLLLSPRFRFGPTILSGNASVASKDIMQAVDRFLSLRVAWFFPQSNVLLFRPREFESYLLKEFPRIATAEITRSYSRELTLRISERSLWGLYCKTSVRYCYYITEDGVLVTEAPQLTGNVVFRIIDLRTKAAFFLLGDAPLGESDVDFVQKTATVLESQYHITVHEMVLGRVFEDQTELMTNEGWYVLFDEQTKKDRALENLTLVLSQQITDRADLEYVDIRFEGKVFFKKK